MDNKEDNDIDYDDAMGKLEEKLFDLKPKTTTNQPQNTLTLKKNP